MRGDYSRIDREIRSTAKIGSFRLDYEYEIEYEYDFRSVTFRETSLFKLVLGREGSSWDEMGK